MYIVMYLYIDCISCMCIVYKQIYALKASGECVLSGFLTRLRNRQYKERVDERIYFLALKKLYSKRFLLKYNVTKYFLKPYEFSFLTGHG